MATTPDQDPHRMLFSDTDLGRITISRLNKAGIERFDDVKDYDQLLRLEGLGPETILGVKTVMLEHGITIEGMSHIRTRGQVREDREHLGIQSTRKRGNERVRQPTPSDPKYIKAVLVYSYTCGSCGGSTTVNDGERVPGIEFKGFTYNLADRGGLYDPFFVCITCASDMSIVGSLITKAVRQ